MAGFFCWQDESKPLIYRVRWEPLLRLNSQPMFSNAAKTRLAFVEGQWLMQSGAKY